MSSDDKTSYFLFVLYDSLDGRYLKVLSMDMVDGRIHYDPHPQHYFPSPFNDQEITDEDGVDRNTICQEHNSKELQRAKDLLKTVKQTLKNIPTSQEYNNQKDYLENIIGEYSSWFEKHGLDDGVTVIKMNETDALWSIADDLSERVKQGDFPTKRDAYRWWCEHHTHKGKDVTWESLENEYHKAKSAGNID